jgi:hypothetical protein
MPRREVRRRKRHKAKGVTCGDVYARRANREETDMLNTNSPLENLTAFAIVFATGILSTIALGKYIEKVRRDAYSAASDAASCAA